MKLKSILMTILSLILILNSTVTLFAQETVQKTIQRTTELAEVSEEETVADEEYESSRNDTLLESNNNKTINDELIELSSTSSEDIETIETDSEENDTDKPEYKETDKKYDKTHWHLNESGAYEIERCHFLATDPESYKTDANNYRVNCECGNYLTITDAIINNCDLTFIGNWNETYYWSTENGNHAFNNDEGTYTLERCNYTVYSEKYECNICSECGYPEMLDYIKNEDKETAPLCEYNGISYYRYGTSDPQVFVRQKFTDYTGAYGFVYTNGFAYIGGEIVTDEETWTGFTGFSSGDYIDTIYIDFDANGHNVTGNGFNWQEAYRARKIITGPNLNTSKVKDMSYWFYGYKCLEKLDLTYFDTSSATDVSYMFAGTSLKTIDLSSLDMSNVEKAEVMFSGTYETIKLGNFNSNVKMASMAMNTKVSTLDLSLLDNVTFTEENYNAFILLSCFNLQKIITPTNMNGDLYLTSGSWYDNCVEIKQKESYYISYTNSTSTPRILTRDIGNHNYDAAYTWSDDYTTCTATAICLNDSSHRIEETVNSTCDTKTYIAVFENEIFEDQFIDIKDPEINIDSDTKIDTNTKTNSNTEIKIKPNINNQNTNIAATKTTNISNNDDVTITDVDSDNDSLVSLTSNAMKSPRTGYENDAEWLMVAIILVIVFLGTCFASYLNEKQQEKEV